MAKKGEEYTCAMCKGVFDRAMDDDEAFEETKELFPNSVEQGDPMDIICDDCWNKLPMSQMMSFDKMRKEENLLQKPISDKNMGIDYWLEKE